MPAWSFVAGQRARALALTSAFCLCSITANAQQPSGPDLEKRVRELEGMVRQLQTEQMPVAAIPISQQAPAATAGPSADAALSDDPGRQPILAGWDDKEGFFLRSADDRFHFRVTGQLQADYRAFLDGRDYTDIDSFLVRRARLGIEANMYKYYEFRLLPDFSNAQGPGVFAQTRIQDAYINVHYWDSFQVEAGKFKQPLSYEQLVIARERCPSRACSGGE